jgi:hypothetical protein
MYITKTRIIIADVMVLIVLGAMYFVTEAFTKNVLPIVLIILLVIGRSIFYHVNWYKTTGKIY